MIESIVKIAADAASEIRGKIEFYEMEIGRKGNELSALVTNLSALESQAKTVRDWSDEERAKIEKEQAELKEKISLFEREKGVFMSELEGLKELKASLLKAHEVLKGDIAVLSQEKQSLEVLVSVRDTIVSDVEIANAKLIKARNERAELVAEISKLEGNLKEAEASYLKANEITIKQIEIDKASIIERERALAEKKKELDAKEADLKTVEMRWKKIYESKGLGFKI